MNKKSAILFFSVLVLFGVIFYAWATNTSEFSVSHGAAGDSYTTYGITGWIRGGLNDTVNFTVTMPSGHGGIINFSAVTVEFGEANQFALHTWPNDTLPYMGAGVFDSDHRWLEEWHCNSTGIDNFAFQYGSSIEGNAFDNWTCYNISAASQLGENDQIFIVINMSTNSSVGDELKGVLNYTFMALSDNSTAGYVNVSEYDEVFYIDDQDPRLIEVNISDGNTTLPNATLGLGYVLSNDALTIQAMFEDSMLENRTVLSYNCNSTDPTIDVGDTQQSLAAAPQTTWDIDSISKVTSNPIACTYGSGINAANETLRFYFLVNDTLGHWMLLANISVTSEGPFNITLDDNDILPWISNVNVTQNNMGLGDGGTISKTLKDGAQLDGSEDYLAETTVTFDIEITGGNKPYNVLIYWNDTDTTAASPGATALAPAVIGGSRAVFPAITNLDETMALNATNSTGPGAAIVGFGDVLGNNATGTIYRTALNLNGNQSHNFAFWVIANNTGNNYTRIGGPYKFTVDGEAPSVTMTPPTDLVISPRDSITYTCKASETGGSAATQVMWYLKKPGSTEFVKMQNYENIDAVTSTDSITFTGDNTNLAGTYDVKCAGVDTVGNEREYTSSSSESFSVHYTTTYGGEEAGAGAAADIDLSTAEEITITEKQGTISTFTLDGTTIHTIKIKTVDEAAGTVTIVIESDPIEITLKIGEMKEVDVDADGANDISVTLNKITDGVADITTKRLTPLPAKEVPTEEVPPTEKPAEEIPTAEAASKTWLWILIIVIIVVIGVGYWFMKRK